MSRSALPTNYVFPKVALPRPLICVVSNWDKVVPPYQADEPIEAVTASHLCLVCVRRLPWSAREEGGSNSSTMRPDVMEMSRGQLRQSPKEPSELDKCLVGCAFIDRSLQPTFTQTQVLVTIQNKSLFLFANGLQSPAPLMLSCPPSTCFVIQPCP